MRTALKVLLTGFSSFPGVPVNPSEALVRALADGWPELDLSVDLTTEILPVEYGKGLEAMRVMCRDLAPDLVIAFGVYGSGDHIRLERWGRNAASPDRPDAAGCVPDCDVLRDEAPEALEASLPLTAMEAKLTEHGFDARPSDDAGDYLCNALLYESVLDSSGTPDRKIGFIHIPHPSDEHLSAEDLESVAKLIVETCVADYRAAAR